MGIENRQYPRLEQEFTILYDVVPNTVLAPEPKPYGKSVAKNISGGGLHLVMPRMPKRVVKKLLAHSHKLNLEFRLPDFNDKINILGEVRWAKGGLKWWNILPVKRELGVKFIYTQAHYKDAIIKYVINKQIEEQLSKVK